MRAFRDAVETRDFTAIEQLLADDVVFYGDGGGKGPAIARPLYGRDRVGRFMRNLLMQAARAKITLVPTQVNGSPGAVARDQHGNVASVISLEIAGGQIQSFRSVVNPDKLRHLGPPADLRALIRELGERRG